MDKLMSLDQLELFLAVPGVICASHSVDGQYTVSFSGLARQLADTMREVERLRYHMIELHRVTMEGFIETCIEDALDMGKDEIKALYPNKDTGK